ncbi:MAG: hypothetical protein IT198_07640 [Acidimicrobiia bacterium]|nr:hypothetical protein [Acidimicrobiia bacterium]
MTREATPMGLIRRRLLACATTGAIALVAVITVPGPPTSAAAEDSCTQELRAVATDIDETLTTSDAEWLLSILDPKHDAAERSSAAEVFRAYAERGYRIVYVTARPDGLRLPSGATTRAATLAWLEAHDFPTDPGSTYLYQAPDVLSALLPRGYKASVVEALEDDGYTVDFAYGNALTDFQAFLDAGIPKDRVFSIGKYAGWRGTNGIGGGTYDTHLAAHMPAVEPVCDPVTFPTEPATCPAVAYDDLFAWILEELLGIPPKPHTLACH